MIYGFFPRMLIRASSISGVIDGTTEEIDAESIDCYEDFWDMLDKNDLTINSDCRGSLVRGYSWLSEGAYPIAYFD